MSKPADRSPADQNDVAGSDRRGATRYACGSETVGRLIAARTGELWMATVRDISSTGIGLVLPRRFEPGTLLAFELHNSQQNYTRTLLARVKRVSAESGSNWMLGCALSAPLSEDELEMVRIETEKACSPIAVSPRENRAWVRTTRQGEKVPAPNATSGEQWPATVLNMTSGRIGLLVPHQFKRGALLKIDLQNGGETTARTVLARVLHANAQFGGEWALTCSVAKKRSEDEFAALLS